MATKKKTTAKAKVEVKEVNIDFSNSVEKIKTTAKTVNTEVVDTAIEVLEDLRTNGEKIRVAATARVNEAIENMTVENGVKFVSETAKSINNYSLETAEEVIDATVKGTKEWQALMAKSMKEGVDLYAKGQDITLTALEGLKKRYSKRNFRIKQLLNFDFNFFGANEVAEKAVAKTKTVKKAAVKAAKPVTKKAKATVASAKKAVKTTTKTATKAAKPVAKKATATAKAAVKATKKVAEVATAKDNLKVIEGVGPKIEGLFNKAGIFTFQQLADAKQASLKQILADAGPRFKMHNPATWTKQAALAAAGKKEELAKLQDKLDGGRPVK
ncbi:MAG: hypothetical protein AAGH79_01650 [Bacteroidota bacterium]